MLITDLLKLFDKQRKTPGCMNDGSGSGMNTLLRMR